MFQDITAATAEAVTHNPISNKPLKNVHKSLIAPGTESRLVGDKT